MTQRDTLTETITLGEVPAGTQIERFGDLLILVHPEHPVRFFDKNDPLAGIQEWNTDPGHITWTWMRP